MIHYQVLQAVCILWLFIAMSKKRLEKKIDWNDTMILHAALNKSYKNSGCEVTYL